MDDAHVTRYLGLLGVSRKPPSLNALTELVAAHVTRVPFENISKLYRRMLGITGLPDIGMFLDGIERYNFGGTCYANNFYLYALLASLGYDVKLCGADMRSPDVHMVSMVVVEGREYLVDAGYAAPFLSPLPRDLEHDYVIALGRDRYVLRPKDAKGYSRVELHREGTVRHDYVAKPAARRIADFEQVIADSFRPSATFLNAVLLARFFPERSIVIHNLSVIESHRAASVVRRLRHRGELPRAIEEHFGIPARIAAEAIDGLGQLADAWS